MDENKILKLVEQAYRKGLRDGHKADDLAPHLVVSQIVAHELVKNLTIPVVVGRSEQLPFNKCGEDDNVCKCEKIDDCGYV